MSESVLIAYDGSLEAKRAVEHAGRFLGCTTSYILTVWEPIHRQAARAAGAAGMPQADWIPDEDETDPAYEDAAQICREGVEVAAGVGITAQPYLVESETAVWSAIVDAAEELGAGMLVTGTRGSSGLRSLLSASTAEAVLRNSGLPVFIVPPARH